MPVEYPLSSFLGSFHPLLVHFPIGILLMALGLDAWTARGRHPELRLALPVLYLWGCITAALSCVTGYLLSSDGDYEGPLVRQHQWLGIATAAMSLLLWLRYRGYLAALPLSRVKFLLPGFLCILVIITGHLGGSLTHGEDYLLESAPVFIQKMAGYREEEIIAPVIEDVQQSDSYKDIAAVIFRQKCGSCHGPNKQKGGLRLDAPEWILKGGKNGKVLVSGNPGESELMKRLLLPLQDDDHMPPREKKQLSSEEIAYLHWWISQGGDFKKKVSELAQSDSIKRILKTFEEGGKQRESSMPADLPAEPGQAADVSLVDSLEKLGLLILPLAESSRNLEISFINCTLPPDSILPLIEPLSPQVVSLDLSGKKATDAGMTAIAKLNRLRKLNLAHTAITDQGIPSLASLQDLRYLNLVYTRVTAGGLANLENLRNLTSLYLLGTQVKKEDWSALKLKFPGVSLDSGGYRLPLLATDTEMVKEKRK